MDKNEKLPHLYKIERESGYEGWALNATALFEDGPQLSQAITDGMEKTGLKKGEFIVMALLGWNSGIVARAQVEHALEIAHVAMGLAWTDDELLDVLFDIQKALCGWPTKNTTEFVTKDSDEYKAWVKERDNE